MKNAYQSDEYQALRSVSDKLLKKKYIVDTKTETLEFGFVLNSADYYDKKINIEATMYSVLKDDKLIFSYFCMDNECDFCKVIQCSKTEDTYFVFREDLYGYSVYHLQSDSFYRYFPQIVMDGMEDYIWAGVYFNEENNLLAVNCCIWACPWTVLLVDFKNPMQDNVFVDVNKIINGVEGYDDLSFIEFATEGISIKRQNGKLSDVLITFETCKKYLEEERKKCL